MSSAIRRPLDQDDLDDAAIDRFIADNTFPIVEQLKATFVFRGGADEVFLRHSAASVVLSFRFIVSYVAYCIAPVKSNLAWSRK